MPPPDPPRSKRDAAASRKRLLDAAEREFARSGYVGARLKDIVAEAGVQVTLVHHHFGDKEGLYRSVLDRLLSPTRSQSWSLLQTDPDLESLARGFVTLVTELYATHHNLLAILRHDAPLGTSVLTDLLRDRMAPVAAAATALVLDMQERGKIRRDLSPVEIVALTMSMAAYPFVDEVVLETVLPGGVPSGQAAVERRREAITQVLLRALTP